MISVIYEGKDFIAVDKPAGLLVHPAKNSYEPTLVQEILKKYPEISRVGDDLTRPGIIHRLDKETSGVIIIARNQKFFEYLKKLFQKHEVKKSYLAIVFGRLTGSGVIDKPIGLKSGSTKRSVRAKNMKMVKAALTEYKVIENFEKSGKMFTLVRLIPKTGRTHQLRVHLASIGHPVVGDLLYGPKENPFSLKHQALHAESIEFSNEEGKRIKIEAEPPDDFKKIINHKKF